MRISTKGTPFERALRKFPVGAKVGVDSEDVDWDAPQCEKVVCGHIQFRDSDNDPLICVCLVSIVRAVAGWFPPDSLRKLD